MRKYFLMILMCMFCGGMTPPLAAEPQFITRVEEGPVLVTLSGDRIRLIGVEFNDPALRQEARDFISSWISGTVVDVEYDATELNEQGEYWGYVWFRFPEHMIGPDQRVPPDIQVYYKYYDERNEGFFVFLNASLVKSGIGFSTTMHPNTRYARVFNRIVTSDKFDLPVPAKKVDLVTRSE